MNFNDIRAEIVRKRIKYKNRLLIEIKYQKITQTHTYSYKKKVE
jgi:hypothetical protein